MASTQKRNIKKFGKILLLIGLVYCTYGTAHAEEFRYQYVPLVLPDSQPLPEFDENGVPQFHSSVIHGMNDVRQIAGTYSKCRGSFPITSCVVTPFIYENGSAQLLQGDLENRTTEGGPINNKGLIGGAVNVGSIGLGGPGLLVIPIFHAILLEKEIAPRLLTPSLDKLKESKIISINNKNTVLLTINEDDGGLGLRFYKQGKLKPIRLNRNGVNVNLEPLNVDDLNDRDVVAGTVSVKRKQGDIVRAFWHDIRTGKTNLLRPMGKDNESRAYAINNKGDALGISRNLKSGFQRIGVWNGNGRFRNYYIENIPVTTSDTELLFNNKGLIVASGNPIDFTVQNSYHDLLPKPGLRLKLSDLVVNPPTTTNNLPFIGNIIDINNHGDMIGSNVDEKFMLLGLNP